VSGLARFRAAPDAHGTGIAWRPGSRVSPGTRSSGCRRRSFRLPCLSHPSAVPGVQLRVVPLPHSAGSALRRGVSCLASRIFRLCRWGVESSGRPESPFPSRLRQAVTLRVAPNVSPSGGASGESPGCPGTSLHWLRRIRVFGLPRILPLRLDR